MPDSPDAWWICTAPAAQNGRRKLGPFATRDLAMEVRWYIELVEKRHDLWVLDGAEVPAPSPAGER